MANKILDNLGFTRKNGLVHNLSEARNHVERLYIEEVKRFCRVPNAVFFRRFYRNDADEMPHFSIPSVCIFHQKDSFFNTEEHKKLHAELWSAGNTEVYILLGETRIDILNARKPAKRAEKDVTLDDNALCLVSSAISSFEEAKFSAHLFGMGTFWEQTEFQHKIDSNSNPYNFLLDYLMEARKQLQKNSSIKLTPVTIDKLLITSILIKFLEEIKDDDGKHTLKEIYKKNNLKTETFEEGLRNGKCLAILSDLSTEFNGEIFDTFNEDEKKQITEGGQLDAIANFLSADIDIKTKQGFLWKQYSFKHLPAEVISAIYENFIQAEAARNEEVRKDVVYTPLHLVNLMIDEAMPLEKAELFENQSFKILDPACGSGVFLVAAYKRLLQWWAINHWRKTKTIAYPDKKTAKLILERNIFGVDIEEVAALVTIFGLTTAFLDKLTPKEIWNNLKFQDLSKKNIGGNLNFIDWAKTAKANNENFDLVVGNPPFNEATKGKISNQALKELFSKEVPNNKLALKFLEAALFFGKKVSMIIPSNVFLYNKNSNAHEYRKNIFTNYTVEKIYDFTHLRRNLFHKSADTPIITLLLENKPSEYQSIEHIVVKREFFSEQKMRFEIDYYDKHQVRWDIAIDERKHFVWKTNLLGGGRLFHLIYRLSLLETLEEFINERKKENSEWLYKRGYEIGGENVKKIPAPYIYLQQTLLKFDEKNNIFDTKQELNSEFVVPHSEKLYDQPLLIFSQVMGKHKFAMQLFKTKQVFNMSFVGIHAPIDQTEVLEQIQKRFCEQNFSTYKVYMLSTSAKLMINKETVFVKEDIDSLPYPSEEKYLELSETEKLIQDDILNYYIHLGKATTPKNDGYKLHAPAEKLDLAKFGKTYCDVLNEIYAEDGNSWQIGEVLIASNFICYQFGFGKNDGLRKVIKKETEQKFNTLFNDIQLNSGVHYQRIIRYYDHQDGFDCVYLIKPNTKRYWLPSIALRDADDTFMDLKQHGY